MTRFLTAAAVLATLLAAPALHAEMASGTYDVPVAAGLNVWDISGSYHEDVEGVTMDFTLNVDASGKITGSGTASMTDGYDTLTATFSTTGTLRSAGPVVRVNMTLKMNGSGYVSGYFATFKATLNQKLELDTIGHQMIGTAGGSVTVRVPGIGGRTVRMAPSDTVTPLPEDMDGSFDLSVNVTTNKTRYLGTGTMSLSNGKIIALGATGNYRPKPDKSTLALKGTGLDKALTMNLVTTCTNAQLYVKSLNGRALGQTLRFSSGN